MTQAPGSRGGAGPSPAQFAVEVATLKAFRDRVDGLLTSLDTGAGSPQSISAQAMAPGHPGAGFAEVNAMVSRYQETHAKLVQLSQALSSAIDAITISVDVARLGYENVDAQEIARLWAIHDQEAAAAGPSSATSQASAQNGGGTSSGSPRSGAL